MKLYSFFRSGTSHRLRIALNLKGLTTDYVAVDLRTEAHLQEAFKAIHPQGLVPALDTGEQVLIQSPAIIEWLEENYPTPALLPQDPDARVHVRALAAIVGLTRSLRGRVATKEPSPAKTLRLVPSSLAVMPFSPEKSAVSLASFSAPEARLIPS